MKYSTLKNVMLGAALSAFSIGAMAANNDGTEIGVAPADTPSANAGGWYGVALLSAVVAADGTVDRGSGVQSVTKLGTGTYEIIFRRTVRACTYIGTQGYTGTSGSPPDGTVTVVGRFGQTRGVWLSTYDSAGMNADRAFHLMVYCAR